MSPVGLTTVKLDADPLTGSESSLDKFDFCKSAIQLGVWGFGDVILGDSGLAKALSSQLALVGLHRFGSIVLVGLIGNVLGDFRTGDFRTRDLGFGSGTFELFSYAGVSLERLGKMYVGAGSSEKMGGSEE